MSDFTQLTDLLRFYFYFIDVFEAFVRKVHEHGIQNHPAIKIIMTVGGLVAEVACQTKMDGK